MDRWILSLLNSLTKFVGECYETYEPTKAGRAISDFVNENLSNWFVRLSRKRYWGGEMTTDKLSAYQTLYTCLLTVAKLAAPIAPFYMDQLFNDLNKVTRKEEDQSVHISDFPTFDENIIDKDLEERMDMAQKVSSMVLGLRRKEKLKVRQPLAKIMIPILSKKFKNQLEAVEGIILSEINVKEIEYLTETAGVIKKKIKPDFKALGPKFGKIMKQVAAGIAKLSQDDIAAFELNGTFEIVAGDEKVVIDIADVEVLSEDIPGWTVASEGTITVALDINVTDELRAEGIAREFVNRIQNIRKESDFEVTDKVDIKIVKNEVFNDALIQFKEYISNQTLGSSLTLVDALPEGTGTKVDIEDVETTICVKKNA